MFQLLIDNQLQLRTLHPDDADQLFQVLERNRSRLRPWIHPSSLPSTAEATRKFTIECFFNSLHPMDAMTEFPDYFRELDHYFPLSSPPMEMGIWWHASLVGEIMLSRLHDSFTTAEIGYWIAKEAEGRGIVARCVAVLMDHAIENMGIQSFVIGCAVSNRRSRAIPERLGYRLQATVPNGEVVGEYIYDRVIYGMKSEDWRERNKELQSHH
jgi:ribosomal-protein-serine acetyltransferase